MKAILLVRISSDTQELEEQKKQLTKVALEKKYENKNLINLTHDESAIKLTIDEREGIIKLKQHIEADKSINAVFVWELSRLVRNQTEGHILKDYFFKNKVQFYCINPEIQLFNDEITAPHETGDVVFPLFLQMTENEMRIKKARFHRSKIRNARTGKYSGGFIKFGYKVNKEGYYEINEDEAELIRYIFDEYENGRSTMNIQKELLERGKCNGGSFVREILISDNYTGISNKYGMARIYPQIISTEQFNKCRELAKERNKRADKTKEIYFAKKLIKCVECGTHYIGMKSSIQYLCYGRYGKEAKLKPETACTASASININVLDSLLWRLAKFSEATRTDYIDIKEKENLEIKIIECRKHINESELSINKLNNKKVRIADNYMDGIIDKNRRDLKIKEVNKQMNDTNNYITKKRNEIRKANSILKSKYKTELSDDEYIDYFKNEIRRKKEKFKLIEDDKEKYEIIKKNIVEVNIIEEEKNKTKIVVIKYYNDRVERYRINIKKNPAIVESDIIFNTDEFTDYNEEWSDQFHAEYDENPFVPIQPPLEITKRFVRKKQLPKKKV